MGKRIVAKVIKMVAYHCTHTKHLTLVIKSMESVTDFGYHMLLRKFCKLRISKIEKRLLALKRK